MAQRVLKEPLKAARAKQKLGPNQRKWIKALESGKFAQGIGSLHSRNGFCCLGVACELFKTDAIVTTPPTAQSSGSYDNNRGTAPKYVRDALALYGSHGDAAENVITDDLVSLNDNGASFKGIAQIVKSNPALYFKRTK